VNFFYDRKTIFLISVVDTFFWVSVVFYLVVIWYPIYHFDIFEAKFRFSVFVIVLVLLGPAINAFLYKKDREKYANDLSVVYFIKIVIFFIGLHFSYIQRPVFVVLSVDRFVVVQAHQISLGQVSPKLVKAMLSNEKPPIVAARRLKKNDLGLLMDVMSGAPDIEYRPLNYEGFKYQKREFLERFCSAGFDRSQSYGGSENDCKSVEVPLVYRVSESSTAVYNVDDNRIVRVIEKDPW
jgi:hypothetical protein